MKDYSIIQQAEEDLVNASEAISKKYKFNAEDTIAMHMDFCSKSIAVVSHTTDEELAEL